LSPIYEKLGEYSFQSKSLVLHLGHELGAIRPRNLRARGFHPEYLWQLYKEGKLQRAARGVYFKDHLQAEKLQAQHIIRPGLTLLERAVTTARRQAQTAIWELMKLAPGANAQIRRVRRQLVNEQNPILF